MRITLGKHSQLSKAFTITLFPPTQIAVELNTCGDCHSVVHYADWEADFAELVECRFLYWVKKQNKQNKNNFVI